MLIVIIIKRELALSEAFPLLTSLFGRYQSLQLWHTLLLYIVVPACGMQLSSICCLQMKSLWSWREFAFHVKNEALR